MRIDDNSTGSASRNAATNNYLSVQNSQPMSQNQRREKLNKMSASKTATSNVRVDSGNHLKPDSKKHLRKENDRTADDLYKATGNT